MATNQPTVVQDKIKIVRMYSKCGSFAEVRRQLFEEGVESGKFNRKWGIARANGLPSENTIKRINNAFDETGCVDRFLLKSTVRTKSVTGLSENIERVKEEVLRSPGVSKSSRRLSEITGLHHSAVYTILKELKLKPYIPRLHQKLSECDFDRRVEFCETYRGLVESEQDLADKITFSYEAKFHLSGAVNRHNCVYWAGDRPDNIDVDKTAISPGVTVWCGINSNEIIGPVFFNGTVNKDNFLKEVIDDVVVPYFNRQPHNCLFQQDGASAHYANIVRDRLNDKLNGRWIGRRGAIEWPARSPDLTPCDYFLWGFLKNKVYGQKIRNLDILKETITHFIDEIRNDQELLTRVCRAVNTRVDDCLKVNSGHFERTSQKK